MVHRIFRGKRTNKLDRIDVPSDGVIIGSAPPSIPKARGGSAILHLPNGRRSLVVNYCVCVM